MDMFGSFNFVFGKRPFEDSGECSDEIVFTFDDGKKLYVSQNFLCYASPVFKERFQKGYGETENKVIEMKENSSDFLELLLSLHPGVQKPIDKSNVLGVVSVAEEYKIKSLINRCKVVMNEWLTSEVRSAAAETKSNLDKAKHAKTCLTIMIKAISLGYEEVVSCAIEVLAEFGYDVYTGSLIIPAVQKPLNTFGTSKANKKLSSKKPAAVNVGIPKTQVDYSFFTFTPKNVISEGSVNDCKRMFDSLSEQLKTRLHLQRLKLCDDGNMR
ncbi:uncharacterized protein LOC132718191 [Ruditapes philippinarum]|uniref:uncharacterized protein LOC132718191 n=1 Tax=Ruditapes philippinarum TaxID=129788 RepID=UPI00295AF332|nr:uncharacterized protein LOC132718191 [Ruditapes philippinarum]